LSVGGPKKKKQNKKQKTLFIKEKLDQNQIFMGNRGLVS
jgi:hypothetical protein